LSGWCAVFASGIFELNDAAAGPAPLPPSPVSLILSFFFKNRCESGCYVFCGDGGEFLSCFEDDGATACESGSAMHTCTEPQRYNPDFTGTTTIGDGSSSGQKGDAATSSGMGSSDFLLPALGNSLALLLSLFVSS